MSAKIKTWQERCQTHPDHEGIVTHSMIHARMAEEIDDLREEVKRLRAALKRIETLKVFANGSPASAYQTEGRMRELAREALEYKR